MNVLYSTPKKFISIIEAIALAYSLDLDAERSYLRLEKNVAKKQPSNLFILVIEKLNQNTARVAHYCDDEKLPKKAIAFLTEILDGEDHWTPLEIVQGSQSRQVASCDEDGCITQLSG